MSAPSADVLRLADEHFRARRFDQAEAACREALRANDRDVGALTLLGRVQAEQGRLPLAIAFLSKASALDECDPRPHYYLGMIAIAKGDMDGGCARLERAATLGADAARYHYALGTARLHRGDLARAGDSLDNAVRLDPSFVNAHVNLGVVRLRQHRRTEAVGSLRRAIELDPNNADAWANLGMASLGVEPVRDSLAALRRALELAPDRADVHSNLLLVQQYASSCSAEQERAEARRWALRFDASHSFATRGDDASSGGHHRLRVGYVSGDFRAHSVAYLIEPVLRAHDRLSMEVFCYSTNHLSDAVTERLRSETEHFSVIADLSDAAAAELIRRDGIDVLVDLSGHTAGNRLQLFSRRPAAVQATWLGYSGTTGMASIDYILVDHVLCPAGEEGLFSETPVRLDPVYLTYAPPRHAPPVRARGAPGGDNVTFGCFNNAAKITEEVVDVWARVLHRLPRARMMLKTAHFDEQNVVDRFASLFEAQGVPRDRVTFRGTTSQAELLDLYGEVDIALDPFPYNGCLTSLEAMWMGVPVISLRGDTFVSRMGASLLTSLQLGDLVAETTNDYVDVAVGLATDSARLGTLRTTLRQDVAASAVCNAWAFTRKLEDAFRAMHAVSMSELGRAA